MVQQWDTHYHLYEETQQKAFILHYPLGYLCGGIIALTRGILSIKRKKKLSTTSSFSPLHVFHISEKLLPGSGVKENDIYPSRHKDLTANWCGRSLVLIQPDFLVFYIPSVMLGERKTYVAADIKLLIRGGIPSGTISFWDNKPNKMFLVLCTAWTS